MHAFEMRHDDIVNSVVHFSYKNFVKYLVVLTVLLNFAKYGRSGSFKEDLTIELRKFVSFPFENLKSSLHPMLHPGESTNSSTILHNIHLKFPAIPSPKKLVDFSQVRSSKFSTPKRAIGFSPEALTYKLPHIPLGGKLFMKQSGRYEAGNVSRPGDVTKLFNQHVAEDSKNFFGKMMKKSALERSLRLDFFERRAGIPIIKNICDLNAESVLNCVLGSTDAPNLNSDTMESNGMYDLFENETMRRETIDRFQYSVGFESKKNYEILKKGIHSERSKRYSFSKTLRGKEGAYEPSNYDASIRHASDYFLQQRRKTHSGKRSEVVKRRKRHVGPNAKIEEAFEAQNPVKNQLRSHQVNGFFHNLQTTTEKNILGGARVNRSNESIHHRQKVHHQTHMLPLSGPSDEAFTASLVDRPAVDPGDALLARYPGQDDYVSPQVSVVGVSGRSVELPCRVPTLGVSFSSGGSEKLNKDRILDTSRGAVNSISGGVSAVVGEEEKANLFDSWRMNSKSDRDMNTGVNEVLNSESDGSPPNFDKMAKGGFNSAFDDTEPRHYDKKMAEVDPIERHSTHFLPPQPPELLLWYRDGGDKPIYSYDARPGRGSPSHWRSAQTSPSSRFDPAKYTLTLHHIQLQDAGLYTCSAHYRTGPTLTASATLDVVEPPSKVWIGSSGSVSEVGTSQNSSQDFTIGPLVEGGTMRLTCYAEGGHPPPEISWRDGDCRLDTPDATEKANKREKLPYRSEHTNDDQVHIVAVDVPGSDAPDTKEKFHNFRHRKESKREAQAKEIKSFPQKDARKRAHDEPEEQSMQLKLITGQRKQYKLTEHFRQTDRKLETHNDDGNNELTLISGDVRKKLSENSGLDFNEAFGRQQKDRRARNAHRNIERRSPKLNETDMGHFAKNYIGASSVSYINLENFGISANTHSSHQEKVVNKEGKLRDKFRSLEKIRSDDELESIRKIFTEISKVYCKCIQNSRKSQRRHLYPIRKRRRNLLGRSYMKFLQPCLQETSERKQEWPVLGPNKFPLASNQTHFTRQILAKLQIRGIENFRRLLLNRPKYFKELLRTNRKPYLNSSGTYRVSCDNSIFFKTVNSLKEQNQISIGQVSSIPLFGKEGAVTNVTKKEKRRRSLNFVSLQLNNAIPQETKTTLQSSDTLPVQLKNSVTPNGSQIVNSISSYSLDTRPQILNTEASSTQVSSEIFVSRKRPRSLTHSFKSRISPTRISNVVTVEGGIYSNSLVVEALGREDLQRVFTCQVTNSNATQAILRTATLDMILNPTRLQLKPSPAPLVAGRVSVFVCTTAGDRPPVQLSWALNQQPIERSSVQNMRHDDQTESRLSLTLTPEHDSGHLTCSFTPLHPRLKPLSDSIQLHVEYAPTARLAPGRSVSLSDVREGDDVYFECAVSASPPVSRVRWQRQGKDLRHSAAKGIILSNRSLVLQRVSSANSGNYTCLALNSRGTGVSNALELVVKYAPKCGKQEWSTKGASIGSKVVVPCVLDALPLPSEVTWTFNSTSGHTARIDQAHVRHRAPATSLVVFVPRNSLDFGALHCWGRNLVGTQRQPCVFTVFPAAKPGAPSKCRQVRESGAAVQIECEAGDAGGLNVTFFLEIWYKNQASPSDVRFEDSDDSSKDLLDAGETQSVEIVSNTGQSDFKDRRLKLHSNATKTNNAELLVNVSSSTPSFSVRGLGPGSKFLGEVTSCNSEGCTSSDIFKITRLPDTLEKRTAAMKPAPSNSTMEGSSNTFLVLLALGASTMLLVIFFLTVVAVVMKRRRARARRDNLANDMDHNSEVLDSSQKEESHVDIPDEIGTIPHNDTVSGSGFAQCEPMCESSTERTSRTLPCATGGVFLSSLSPESVNLSRCDVILSGLSNSPSEMRNVVHKNIDTNFASFSSTAGLVSNSAEGSSVLLKKSKNLIELNQMKSRDPGT